MLTFTCALGNIAFNDLQNPSDALGILAQIASNGEHGTRYGSNSYGHMTNGSSQLEYPLVRDGRLSLSKIIQLLQRYKHYYRKSLLRLFECSQCTRVRQEDCAFVALTYILLSTIDPYFPIVPLATLDAVNLTRTARDEPHLLTAVLVIASRGT